MLAHQIETITTDTDTSPFNDKKKGDVHYIAIVLYDSQMDLTLENAQVILEKGRANKPLAWTVTPEELPALWAELVETEKA